MKVGILTYHRVVNDGSTMQAYCLHRLLRSVLPSARVEIVDYWGAALQRREWFRSIGKRPPFIKFDRLRKAESQLRFLREHCEFSEKRCMTDDLRKARHFLESQKYDAVFVGSDTIWEVRKNGGGPFPPNLFFLTGVRGPKKISFAASSSKTDPAALARMGLRSELCRSVTDFDEITCRDEGTMEFVRDLGVPADRIQYMPDPTLVGDFPRAAEEGRILEGSKIAGLAVGNPRLRVAFAEHLQALGYEVVCFLGASPDGCRPLPGNLDVLGRAKAHREISLFVTDRFHGSIFTFVQNDAPVVLIEERRLYPEGVWKGRDLYRRLGIEDMIWPIEPGAVTGPDGIRSRITAWDQLLPRMKSRLTELKTAGRALLGEILTRQDLRADASKCASS